MTLTKTCTVTADSIQAIKCLAVQLAVLLSAMPVRSRVFARLDFVRQVEQRLHMPRGVSCFKHSVENAEIRRIAKELASVFRVAPIESHPWLWPYFGSEVSERMNTDEILAECHCNDRQHFENLEPD